MQVTIKINAADIQGQIDKKVKAIVQDVHNAIQGAGITCEAVGKQECPVDTGRLRSSIHYERGKLKATVGTNVKYAYDVHNGHVTRRGNHVGGRPFLLHGYVRAKK